MRRAAGKATSADIKAFVAMPFRMAHSHDLSSAIEDTCHMNSFEANVASRPINPAEPLRADIVEQLRQAEIVIVDLTGRNVNVEYEFGYARILGKEILLLHHEDQSLGDLQNVYAAIPFGDIRQSDKRRAFTVKLDEHLQKVQLRLKPEMLDSVERRTQRIVDDLREFCARQPWLLCRETLYSSGYLSSFSLGSDDGFETSEMPHRRLLLQERDALMQAARQGCRVVCIISPPPNAAAGPGITTPRVRNLLAFIRSGDRALDTIDWILSFSWQKNFLIIGNMCCYERFQKITDRGDALTLRQASQAAVRANTAIYDLLSTRLMYQMLKGVPPSNLKERRELLRVTVEAYLEQSLTTPAAVVAP